MKKLSLPVAVLLLVVVMLATEAFTQPLSVRNGIVRGMTAGQSLSIASYGRAHYDYSLTANTKILPDSMAGSLQNGSRVVVYAKCYQSSATKGCIALDIIVLQALAPSAQGSSSQAQPTSQPAPQATPTP